MEKQEHEVTLHAITKVDFNATCFDARERALLNFVRRTVVDVDVDDATWEGARAAFSEREIVELLLVSGFYRTMCTIMRTARLPIEPATS
jgi:4-carboxymuconolactone decarboxylase